MQKRRTVLASCVSAAGAVCRWKRCTGSCSPAVVSAGLPADLRQQGRDYPWGLWGDRGRHVAGQYRGDIIDALRHERHRFSPVKRVYIPKKSGRAP